MRLEVVARCSIPPRLPGRPGDAHRCHRGNTCVVWKNPALRCHPLCAARVSQDLLWRECAPCRNSGAAARLGRLAVAAIGVLLCLNVGGCAAHPARHRHAGALVLLNVQPLLLELTAACLGLLGSGGAAREVELKARPWGLAQLDPLHGQT